tara:strand:- start:6363 stop:6695 length:333 start_codon:yes stop_codon:yes gene_type:complete
MKNLILIVTILFASLTVNAQKKEKTYKVIASCGSCQLDMTSKTGCALAIQYGGKKYWVDGTEIADHGDEHAEDGFCEATRKAEVKGTFKDDRFIATSFKLIPEKKKKKKK